MPDTGNAKDCLELPPTNFSIFTLKNVTWRIYLISFTVQYCFLFRFVCVELVSLIWFLQIWVAIYVYGTMINWSTLIKKLMQTYIVIVSGSILNVSTVHLNGIWHLIWRYLSKPVLGGHYSIPRGCPLNTGFPVSYSLVKISVLCLISSYVNFIRSLLGDISKSRNIDKEIKLEVSFGPYQPSHLAFSFASLSARSLRNSGRENESLLASLSRWPHSSR